MQQGKMKEIRKTGGGGTKKDGKQLQKIFKIEKSLFRPKIQKPHTQNCDLTQNLCVHTWNQHVIINL
jgi:hypothetical protein